MVSLNKPSGKGALGLSRTLSVLRTFGKSDNSVTLFIATGLKGESVFSSLRLVLAPPLFVSGISLGELLCVHLLVSRENLSRRKYLELIDVMASISTVVSRVVRKREICAVFVDLLQYPPRKNCTWLLSGVFADLIKSYPKTPLNGLVSPDIGLFSDAESLED